MVWGNNVFTRAQRNENNSLSNEQHQWWSCWNVSASSLVSMNLSFSLLNYLSSSVAKLPIALSQHLSPSVYLYWLALIEGSPDNTEIFALSQWKGFDWSKKTLRKRAGREKVHINEKKTTVSSFKTFTSQVSRQKSTSSVLSYPQLTCPGE